MSNYTQNFIWGKKQREARSLIGGVAPTLLRAAACWLDESLPHFYTESESSAFYLLKSELRSSVRSRMPVNLLSCWHGVIHSWQLWCGVLTA